MRMEKVSLDYIAEIFYTGVYQHAFVREVQKKV